MKILKSQRDEQKMQIEVQFLGKPIFEAWVVPVKMSHPKCNPSNFRTT